MTLQCKICNVPNRAGAQAEADAALSVLQHISGVKVALQYKLPDTQKPWDMLVSLGGQELLVEVDGTSHKNELPTDRRISKRTNTTKMQRRVEWRKLARQHGLQVLRVPDVDAKQCGQRVAAMLQTMFNTP